MPKRSAPPPPRRSGCPISTALDVLGDRWSLLVVRDLLFKGLRTFGEFAAAGEGVATNVLAERLRRLQTEGIVVRAPDADDARRVVYRLTPKGLDLAPVLVELVLWAAKHERTDAPPAVVRRMRTRKADFIAEHRARAAALDSGKSRLTVSHGLRTGHCGAC
jgi:DNA-binding HxlR family transcriptional regulator